MTITEAQKICRNYYMLTNPGEEDQFLYAEALDHLIRETGNPDYVVELGAMYYEQRRFDLALKYYELAAEDDNLYAISNLGYIWYYGRTGQRDYQKAFHYFDRARQAGDLVAAYKVADMYRNGYYVEKDPEHYKAIIEELYPKVRNAVSLSAPFPEVLTRLAGIRTEEGDTEEALRLYDLARDFLAQRIRMHAFFGDLNIMKWMIGDIYRLRPFDRERMDLYDLYHLLRAPVTVRFIYEDEIHEVQAVPEDGLHEVQADPEDEFHEVQAAPGEEIHEMQEVPEEQTLAIRFDDKWYRTADEFFQRAELEGELLTTIYEELYEMEVLEWN